MNTKISNGMKMLFIAQIGAICCGAIAVTPYIGTALGTIGALVFAVISMIGLWSIGQEVPACKTAFFLEIVSAVLSLLSLVPILGKLCELADVIVSFIIVYLICSSLASVIRDVGAPDDAAFGDLVWKLELVCSIFSFIATILSWIPVINVIAAILLLPASLFIFVVGILYIIFLYKGYKVLS